MKLVEIRPNQGKINIEAVIVELDSAREINSASATAALLLAISALSFAARILPMPANTIGSFQKSGASCGLSDLHSHFFHLCLSGQSGS